MNASLIRVWGTITVSFLVCLIFIAALVVAYITKDQSSQQLIVGAIIGQFSAVVSYFVGSSAGSAQKDEKLELPGTSQVPGYSPTGTRGPTGATGQTGPQGT